MSCRFCTMTSKAFKKLKEIARERQQALIKGRKRTAAKKPASRASKDDGVDSKAAVADTQPDAVRNTEVRADGRGRERVAKAAKNAKAKA